MFASPRKNPQPPKIQRISTHDGDLHSLDHQHGNPPPVTVAAAKVEAGLAQNHSVLDLLAQRGRWLGMPERRTEEIWREKEEHLVGPGYTFDRIGLKNCLITCPNVVRV